MRVLVAGMGWLGEAVARELAAAVMAGLPVALVYLIFQRRVTQAIMLSAGIKG